MGLTTRIFGGPQGAAALGTAVREMAEVLSPDATARAATEAAQAQAAGSGLAPTGRFDRFVNGLNRLPRPLLALGTLGLFAFAMADPAGFGVRMQGLAQVPEPLWWLMGAIVAFYFGAREAHYIRARPAAPAPAAAPAEEANPALDAWRAGGGR